MHSNLIKMGYISQRQKGQVKGTMVLFLNVVTLCNLPFLSFTCYFIYQNFKITKSEISRSLTQVPSGPGPAPEAELAPLLPATVALLQRQVQVVGEPLHHPYSEAPAKTNIAHTLECTMATTAIMYIYFIFLTIHVSL